VTPDVNVLVAAFRADHLHHRIARAWLMSARGECAQGRSSFVLLPMVCVSFLRLTTNRRVFVDPDPIGDAIAFLDVIARTPGVELGDCGPEWPILCTLLLQLDLRGNLVTDAWIAASVVRSREHLVTFDRDFARLLPARDLTVLQ
jgi:uncharacterized protein